MFRFPLLSVLLLAAFPAPAQEGDWLAGTTWVLCESVQSESVQRDVLVFEASGTGKLMRPEGSLGFQHEVSGNTVALRTAPSQRPVQMEVSPNRERLLLRDPEGRPTASYARQGSAAMAGCTVR